MKTRFILLGGFLGAGKTTLIGQLAQRYIADGKTVAIITNDQAADLVDTLNLRSQGFDVGEVAGACFCCSFDDLVETAGKLGQGKTPDVIIAEPVGSCTDLVATVVLPLQQILGDQFELAPFGVLLKPSHGKRILNQSDSDSARSGFSPQAEYIFRKQLEEADYLMIGRADQLTDAEAESLRQQLNGVAPDVPVVLVSPKTGQGVDEVLGYIESPMIAGRRLLEIDYDTYADGEAELGWVNLTATLTANSEINLDECVTSLVGDIAESIRSIDDASIAHLKASLIADDTQAIANVVSNDSPVDLGLSSGRSASTPMQVVVNARVAMDPVELESICTASVHKTASDHSAEAANITAHSLRPGRPTPTHRVTSA
ncbi:putative GTP-binding protein YjiA [Rubripirellula obstinata]|uniref:Putative GTP-binding protein YjiA n=1 Tax=Rubripirellula obstinata TaxID=406547 RepID=A0A5B1CLN5_9BACT|nr:GTP-binding protein [Rubripirellula obstinata]KAA1262117.1 putative GTP-binding protein YjiA [Rubripirellula obstinata]